MADETSLSDVWYNISYVAMSLGDVLLAQRVGHAVAPKACRVVRLTASGRNACCTSVTTPLRPLFLYPVSQAGHYARPHQWRGA
jgi:hypothetical protein